MSRARGKLALVRAAPAEGGREHKAQAVIVPRGGGVSAETEDSSFMRDSYASTALADLIDRSVHAATARFTAGLSPIAIADAYLDWGSHLAFSPGKRSQLVEKATKKALRFAAYSGRRAMGQAVDPCIVPLPQDRRFVDPGWRDPPFEQIYHAFL